jgi:predicted PurR-regulated permease PerM
MSLAVEVAVIVIAVALVLLIGFLIPVALQVRKTAKSAEVLLTNVNRDVEPILRSLNKSVANLEEASAKFREGAHSFAEALGTLKVVGEVVKGTGDLVTGNVVSFLGRVGSLAVGYKTGLKYLFSHLFQKEVKDDEQ